METKIHHLPQTHPMLRARHPSIKPLSKKLLRIELPRELGLGAHHFAPLLKQWPDLPLVFSDHGNATRCDLALSLRSRRSAATIASVEWVFVASPHYCLHHDIAPKLSDLDEASLRFILPDYGYAPIGAGSVIIGQTAQECTQAALSEIGIAAMPRALALPYLHKGELVAFDALMPDIPNFVDLDGPAIEHDAFFSTHFKSAIKALLRA